MKYGTKWLIYIPSISSKSSVIPHQLFELQFVGTKYFQMQTMNNHVYKNEYIYSILFWHGLKAKLYWAIQFDTLHGNI